MIKRVGRYELHELLGEGAFGKVQLVINVETNEKFAVKILDKGKIKQDNLIENLRREIQIMKSIEHPNIVKLYEVLSSHTKIYLVLELVTEGELLQKLLDESVSEDESRFYFQQIISGISFCEQQHIAHRDLKLENVLLDAKGVVKISDFGLSNLFMHENAQDLMHTTCGTVNYLAPEVFGNQGYDGHVADVWSCGVILYALFTRSLPFEHDSISKLIELIVVGDFEVPQGVSPEALDLLAKLLCVDPRTRITIKNIQKHPWFVKNYEEPVGVVRVQRVSEFTDIEDENPLESVRMDAFELIGFCAGLSMNRMFDSSDTEELSSYFTSRQPCETIIARVKDAMRECSLHEEYSDLSHRYLFTMSTPPAYTVLIEIRELLPSYYLTTFSRETGSLVLHQRVFGRVKGLVNDIIHR